LLKKSLITFGHFLCDKKIELQCGKHINQLSNSGYQCKPPSLAVTEDLNKLILSIFAYYILVSSAPLPFTSPHPLSSIPHHSYHFACGASTCRIIFFLFPLFILSFIYTLSPYNSRPIFPLLPPLSLLSGFKDMSHETLS
jgi:hypothetical protein